jgi:Sulfotransferase domain
LGNNPNVHAKRTFKLIDTAAFQPILESLHRTYILALVRELGRKRFLENWVKSKVEVVRCCGSRTSTLPSFFIVGPPRTGTTWLHEILRQRVNLPTPTKETRFFDQHFHRGLGWYLAHFPGSCKKREIGEVAPTYFASEEARERIARLVPIAKVICIFRNPVERVLSLYKVKRAYGMLPWNLEEAVVNDPELIESGRYASHFNAWRAALSKDQVLGVVYEDVRRDPQAYVNTITDFIGVPRIPLSPGDIGRTHESDGLTHPRSYFLTRAAHELAEWFKAERMDRILAAIKRRIFLKALLRSGRKFEPASPEFIAKLYELFRSEIDELEIILDRDLSAWKASALAVVA